MEKSRGTEKGDSRVAEYYKWKKRLSGLDESEQKKIALKYYGGHMPWKT